jgi:uncharacterized membrane protein
MLMLAVGLILFLGLHLLPAWPEGRLGLVRRLGERRYKGAFALLSFAGLALIVGGYATAAPGARLFESSPAAIAVAPYAMTLSLILLAAANMRGHIRRVVRHPMLLGVAIWATVHLLANGDTRGTVLFASFLGYTVLDFISVLQRHATKPFTASARHDVIAIVGGVTAAIVLMAVHRLLFGVTAVAWGA